MTSSRIISPINVTAAVQGNCSDGFQCIDDQQTCISKILTCDGVVDCQGEIGEDEAADICQGGMPILD